MISTNRFGLREEWIKGFAKMCSEGIEFQAVEIENSLGLGVRQTPAFLTWMKGLGFIEKEKSKIQPTPPFLKILEEDPFFSSRESWYRLVLRAAHPDFPLEMVTWYLNNRETEVTWDSSSFIQKFSQSKARNLSPSSLENGYCTFQSFFLKTPVGKDLGFFRGSRRGFSKSPILPSVSFTRKYLLERNEKSSPGKLEENLLEEEKPGGIIRVFGDQIRSQFFSILE